MRKIYDSAIEVCTPALRSKFTFLPPFFNLDELEVEPSEETPKVNIQYLDYIYINRNKIKGEVKRVRDKRHYQEYKTIKEQRLNEAISQLS